MAATAVDVGFLAASFELHKADLQTLLETPTSDLVQEVLEGLQKKAREFVEAKAEKLRVDIELESAVRSEATRTKALKASVDQSVKDNEALRQKLSEQETARAEAESELRALKASTSSATSQIETLTARIESLQSQNRDTYDQYNSKCKAYDQLQDDLSAQQQKLVTVRKQLSATEDESQSLKSAAQSARLRELSNQQRIDSLQRNNDWLETEAKTRQAEHAKFRQEKTALIVQLERQKVDDAQTIESLKRKEESQARRITDLNQKVEELLNKIQQLEEAKAIDDESARAERNSLQRLVDLHKKSAEDAMKQFHEVERQRLDIQAAAAEEISQLQTDIETERQQKLAAEARVAELESQVEKLEIDLSEANAVPIHQVVSTPRRAINGVAATPKRPASPAIFSPRSTIGRHSQTPSRQLQLSQESPDAELRRLRDVEKKLRETMREMVVALESKEPEVQSLTAENERLTQLATETSTLVGEATKEKDQAKESARRLVRENKTKIHEIELQRKQLRDVSAQVTVLLAEQKKQELGFEALNSRQQDLLEQVAKGELRPDQVDDRDDSHRAIRQRVVLFKDINQLQAKHQEALNMLEAAADAWAKAGADPKEIERKEKELDDLRDLAASKDDQISSLNLRIKGYLKECESLRAILSQRGLNVNDSAADSQAAASAPQVRVQQTVEQSPAPDHPDFSKSLRDMQAYIETLKQESSTDLSSLKQQVEVLAKEKSTLHVENARLSSNANVAQDRYESLRNSFNDLQVEKDSIQKALDSVREATAKQDGHISQISAELGDMKNLVESLRTENSNLKTDRELWRSVEGRMLEENKSLLSERDALTKRVNETYALGNQQLQAEMDHRRQLQSRTESLEAELQNVKRKLDDEVQDSKKAAARREYEQEQNRKRIDDLNVTLHTLRPELAAVKAQRDQLQARVDELKEELSSAEGRIPRRPAPAQASQEEADEDDELPKMERLEYQVSDLQSELEIARGDVADLDRQVEHYRTLAEENEERFNNMTETVELNNEKMLQDLAAKDAKIADLDKRIEEISTELAETSAQLSEARRLQQEDAVKFSQEKATLESDLLRWKDDYEAAEERANGWKESVKFQADIATKASQDCEKEIVKAGQAIMSLQSLREEHQKLKAEVSDIKARGDAARTTLEQNEEHWSEMRDRYENELAELRTRNADLKDQNKIVHEQLDRFSSQIADLNKSRMSVAAGAADAPSSEPDAHRFQEVINYLRSEKEIVEVQLEMKLQENSRQRHQLEHAQSQLDDVREKLAKEQASQVNNQAAAVGYENLVNKLSELNTLRESNAFLRSDLEGARSKLKAKTKELDDLNEQLWPLKEKVGQLEGEVELKKGEYQLLENDRNYHRDRVQKILHNYDRVDPEELENLKTQIKTMETERDEAIGQKQPLQEQIEDLTKQLQDNTSQLKSEMEEKERDWNERKERIITQAREKHRDLNKTIKDKDATISTLTAERDDLKQQLSAVQQELQTAQQQLATTQEELQATRAARDEALASSKPDTVMDDGLEAGQVKESDAGLALEERQSLQARIEEAENRANGEANRSVALHIQLEGLKSTVSDLETQRGELQQRIAELNTELNQAKEQVQAAQNQTTDVSAQLAPQPSADAPVADLVPAADLEKLREELAAKQKEVEDLRTAAVIDASRDNAVQPPAEASVDEDYDATERELTNIDIQKAKESYDKKANSLRTKLNNTLRDLKANHKTETDNLESKYKAEIEELKAKLNQAPAPQDGPTAAAGQSVKAEEQASEPAEVSDLGKLLSDVAKKLSELSDMDVKNLVNTNEYLKAMVKRNVLQQLAKSKSEVDETLKRTNDEHEKRLAEVTKQHEEDVKRVREEYERKIAQLNKDHEEELKGAKSKIKEDLAKEGNMKIKLLQERSRKTQAQVNAVSSAATETPDKPVSEVWAIAKTAKPPPMPSQAPSETAAAAAASTTSSAPNAPQTLPPAQTTVPPQPSAQPAGASQLQPTPASQSNGSPVPAAGQPNSPALGRQQAGPFAFGAGSNKQPGQQGQNLGQPNSSTQAQAGQASGTQPQAGSAFGFGRGLVQPGFAGKQNQTVQTPPFGQQPHNQHQEGGRGRGQDNNAGTGPKALQSLLGGQQGQSGQQGGQTSSIPRGGRGGSQLPRGGGGRGRGILNPNAASFNAPNEGNQGNHNQPGGGQQPRGGRGGNRGGRGGNQGQKRGRDDNDSSQGGNKRQNTNAESN